jgi:hypothetical protein
VRDAAAATAVYVVITLLFFYNLVPVAATDLYSDLGDPLLNTSIMAWSARHAPLTAEWWNFPSFAPLSGVTAFTEHLLATYPVAAPIIWLTGNAVLAHNIVLMGAFPLNGLAAYLLARALTGSATAAFVGGLAFAFAPYHSVHLSHVQTLIAFGMPLALLGLHQRRWWLFGLGWLITALSNAYMLVFFPVLVALWCVWFIRPREWRRLVPMAVTAVVCSLPLIPLLRGYQVRQAAYGFGRDLPEIRSFSADVIGLLGISHREWLWRGLLPHTYEESALFPGLTIACLALMAVIAFRGPQGSAPQSRQGPQDPAAEPASSRPMRRGPSWSARLLWLSAALTLIVVARIWTGPFGWHIGPIPLPPFAPFRLFTVAAAAALAGMLLTSRVREAWSRRDVVMFYALAAMALWLLALGPQPEWSASRFRALTYGPYYLFVQLPGVTNVRVPARAWLPAVLCLSMLASFGAAAIVRRWIVLFVVGVAIVAEAWVIEHTVRAPDAMPPGIIPPRALVLDLPIDEGFWNATPQYRAVLGGYRTLNGYSGYEPPHFNPMRHAIADFYPDALDPWRTLADVYVIIRPGVDPRTTRWLAGHPGARVVSSSPEGLVMVLPRLHPESPVRPLPLPLPRAGARPFGPR